MTPGIARALFDSNGCLIIPESFSVEPNSYFYLVTINFLEFMLVPAQQPHYEHTTFREFFKDYPEGEILKLIQVTDEVKIKIPPESMMRILKIIQFQDMYIKVTNNDLIRFYDRSDGKYKNLVHSHQPQLQ